MHKKTAKLRAAVNKAFTLKKRVDLLRNAYAGETCYVMTCGPSMGDSWSDEVRDFLSDKLVMAVKQTYDLAPEICDFHILNSWNYSPYAYAERRPIVVAERAKNDPATPGMKADLLFRVPDPSNFEHRLATSWQFDKWLLTETLDRPWGPGVMYELCFYLLVHMGVKEIVTIGWDLGERNVPTMNHFFEAAPNGTVAHDGIANRPRIRPFEVSDIAASTKGLYYWLRSKGVALYVVSDRSLVDDVVPRLATPASPRKRTLYETELLSNGQLSVWQGTVPKFWIASPNGDVASPIQPSGNGLAVAVNGATHEPGTLTQQIRMESFFSGATLRATIDAKCDRAQGCGLTVRIIPKTKPKRKPIETTVDYPGDGEWNRLEIDVMVPPDFSPHMLEFELVSRGEKTAFRNGSVWLRKAAE